MTCYLGMNNNKSMKIPALQEKRQKEFEDTFAAWLRCFIAALNSRSAQGKETKHIQCLREKGTILDNLADISCC